ncbi:MAG: aldo/keto reductase [Planctomycetota bacterium]|jgi:aryl-alcohol dehydrogenase-like predicted oxidoreductase
MNENELSRRDFIRNTSLAAAGTVVGALTAAKNASAKSARKPSTSNILNYNPDMEYRRLGKTNLMVSAVCLGGHWKRVDVMNQPIDENRYDVMTRCIEKGINYVDACWCSEVTVYAKALKGRRDKFYLAMAHGSMGPRKEDWRTAKKLMQGIDELLDKTGLEYADLWRIVCLEPGGRHSFNTACEIVKALEKAKKQGKARYVGFSTHDRRWIKFMVEYFPQIDVVIFPYTSRTRKMPKDSVFDALAKCDVGAFGIKPFAGNSLFKGSSAPNDPNAADDDKKARLAIRYILCNPHIIPIPGLVSPHQVDNVAKAVKERRELDVADAADLEKAMAETWARLPQNYQWLKDWQYV